MEGMKGEPCSLDGEAMMAPGPTLWAVPPQSGWVLPEEASIVLNLITCTRAEEYLKVHVSTEHNIKNQWD